MNYSLKGKAQEWLIEIEDLDFAESRQLARFNVGLPDLPI